ncbi:MAG TPA: accessory factor UbiK family protein [Sphingomonas sp.]|uniref:accessory factor UbiK family protein n=1 Tax=Sphingomonas sp. TaxID=28214 RepID=UPI002C988DE0|nr:accessory factor UbiK family protein [Sphingomonas sp.]HMI21229.1 accessory factor UbiK family protein [Sphingomonas sp.]
MQTENKFFEDLVKMANGFAGTMAGVGREAETNAREKFKSWIGGVDFVSREEFEAVKAMAAAARDDVAVLKAELAAARDKGSAPTSYDAPSDGPSKPAPKPRKK